MADTRGRMGEAERRVELAKETAAKHLDLSQLDLDLPPTGILNLHVLESLDLSYNRLGPLAADLIASLFRRAPRLLSLALGENILGDEFAVALSTNFKSAPQLEQLDLGSNDIHGAGVEALMSQMEALPRLTYLSLRDNPLKRNGASAVARHLHRAPFLTQLFIESTECGPDGIAEIAAQLAKVPALTHLGIASNGCGDQGIGAIAQNLSSVCCLSSLNTRNNSIGDEGAAELAEHFNSIPRLTRLDVSSNQIGDVGLAAVAQHLSELPVLEELFLAHNRLRILDESLGSHPSLRRLAVDGNSLGMPQEMHLVSDPKRLWAFWSRSQRAGGGDIFPEVKVQLLGNGGTGKTCVSHVLSGRTPPVTHSMTASFESSAIDIGDVVPLASVEEPWQRRFRAAVFDYGGQPHLHGSHRFFLADRRNLWLVVVRSDQSRVENRLDYWLSLVRHEHDKAVRDRVALRHLLTRRATAIPETTGAAPLPPTVIVLESWCMSAGSGRLERLDEEALSTEHGLRVRVVRGFDSNPGTRAPVGATALTEAIRSAVANMPELWTQRFPASFHTLRSALTVWLHSKDGTRVRTTGEWRQWLQAAKVEPDFSDVYLHVLRDLGCVLYVGDRFEVHTRSESTLRTTIFNPNWLKGPVYRVLWGNAETGREGHVGSATMYALLAGEHAAQQAMSEDDCRDILALMQECDLVFPIAGAPGEERWLVPDHLVECRPGERASWGTADTVSSGNFKFLPDYALLPLIGNHYEHRMADVRVARDQFAYEDPLTMTSPRVRVLVQANFATSRIVCSLQGSDSRERDRSFVRLAEFLDRSLGLRSTWETKERAIAVSLSNPAGSEPESPIVNGILETLRNRARELGLGYPLSEDFVRAVKEIVRESKGLGPAQGGIYRALNIAHILPELQHRVSEDRGRVARDRKHIESLLAAINNSRSLGAWYWDAFGLVSPGEAAFEGYRQAYQRAFRRVFPTEQ